MHEHNQQWLCKSPTVPLLDHIVDDSTLKIWSISLKTFSDMYLLPNKVSKNVLITLFLDNKGLITGNVLKQVFKRYGRKDYYGPTEYILY